MAFLILEDILGAYPRRAKVDIIPVGHPPTRVCTVGKNYVTHAATGLCEPFRQIINFPLLFRIWLRKMGKFR